MSILSTYSGRDVNVTITSPLIGQPIQCGGIAANGLAQFTVRMTVDQSVAEVGMDGAVVPSVVPGDQGHFELQVFQTSTLQQQLLALYNAQKTAELAGDVSNWFAAQVVAKAIVGAASHSGTGVGVVKFPDKPYQAQAQRVTWMLLACLIVNE